MHAISKICRLKSNITYPAAMFRMFYCQHGENTFKKQKMKMNQTKKTAPKKSQLWPIHDLSYKLDGLFSLPSPNLQKNYIARFVTSLFAFLIIYILVLFRHAALANLRSH
jgi:hypothetical protein